MNYVMTVELDMKELQFVQFARRVERDRHFVDQASC